MYKDIKELSDEGFALHLLKKNSKAPINARWSEAPLNKWAEIKHGLDGGFNLGVRLGEPSRVDGGYLHVIDLDIRVDDEAEDALLELGEILEGVKIKRLPTVISGSGGESRHFYFITDQAFRSRKLATSGVKFEDSEGKKHWTWEIELFGTGKQVALPPSIHPDTGLEYEWIIRPDFDLGIPTVDSTMIGELVNSNYEESEGDDDALGITYEQAEDYLEKLDFDQWGEDREGWRNVGMALHHEFEGHDDAFEVWCEFSSRSEKFDKSVCRQQWRSFGKNRDRPIRMATIKAEVKDVEIRYEFDDDEDLPEEDRKPREPRTRRKEPSVSDDNDDDEPIDYLAIEKANTKALNEIPANLMMVPGILGQVVKIYNDSAIRKQPQFAVQAALAVGSVVLGRNYVTNQENYSSLYFVNLGQTGSGKEHAKTVIEKVLIQAGQRDLIGPKSYTSDAGLMSALLAKPRHISVSDEFGRYLASSRSSGDTNKQDAQSALMEVWGRLSGEHLEKGYSTHGMSAEQAQAVHDRRVVRPALTMMGLTTPGSFYAALGDADLTSGFLNRFIVVETDLPRQRASMIKPIVISDSLSSWVKKYVWGMTDDNEEHIDDIMGRINSNEVGDAIQIPFSKESFAMLAKIDDDSIRMMNKAGSDDIAAMYSRMREIIMRLSLIVALSCQSRTILPAHVEWSREYVYFYQGRLVEAIRDNIGVPEEEITAQGLAKAIYATGDDGMTMREITRFSRQFNSYDSRRKDEVMRRLKEGHGVKLVQIKKHGKREIDREVYTI